MATRATPIAPASGARPRTSFGSAVKTAQAVLVGSAAVLLVMGLVIWTGRAENLIPLHLLVGIVLVLSLWTIAAIAARSGVSGRLVAMAVGWSIVATIFGTTQEALWVGDWHWTVQVLHVVIAIGMVAWGRLLAVLTLEGDW